MGSTEWRDAARSRLSAALSQRVPCGRLPRIALVGASQQTEGRRVSVELSPFVDGVRDVAAFSAHETFGDLEEGDAPRELRFRWPSLSIGGSAHLFATATNAATTASVTLRETKGDTGATSPLDAWLESARSQRLKLSATVNGRRLMSLFNEHNEVFHEIFSTNVNLQNTWTDQGATAEMATDTSAAISTNSTINSSTKEYGAGGGYNLHAVKQAMAVAAACIGKAGPKPSPTNPYATAAAAVMAFLRHVTAATGNGQYTTVPMAPAAVFETVGRFSASAGPSDVDRNAALMLGAYLAEGSAETLTIPGVRFTAEDRAELRGILKAAEAPTKPDADAEVSAGTAELHADWGSCEAQVSFGPDGLDRVVLRASPLRITLRPATTEGNAAPLFEAMGPHLEQARFVHGLVRDRARRALVAEVSTLLGELDG